MDLKSNLQAISIISIMPAWRIFGARGGAWQIEKRVDGALKGPRGVATLPKGWAQLSNEIDGFPEPSKPSVP